MLLGEPAQGWIKAGVDDKRQGLVPIAFLDLSSDKSEMAAALHAHAQHHSVPTTLEVKVPRSIKPGQEFRVKVGPQSIYLICPANVKPGGVVRFKMPDASEEVPPPQPAPISSPAVDHAECPVCFAEMVSKPVSTLKYQGRRACTHFVHFACARALFDSGMLHCPVCHSSMDTYVLLPSPVDDPMGWFDAVDFDGNKRLSRMEVAEVIKATCRIDWRQFDKDMDQLWTKWSKSGEGDLSFYEVEGLLKYVNDTFKPAPEKAVHAPPVSDKKAWFEFFDEDKSGYLDQDEVFRGIVKSQDFSEDLEKVRHLQESIEVLWVICDSDGSGFIELEEFLVAGGLADQLVEMLKKS